MRRALVLFVVLLPSAAWPQGEPLGPEFRVNTYTTIGGGSPSVTVDSSGNFVVVWTGLDYVGSGGIFAQRYASGGAPLGPEFRVNTYTTGQQYLPAVASDASGNFVVIWSDFGHDGSYGGVFAQRYASSGVPLGPEFRVNTETSFTQRVGSVAAGGAGEFVVVWESRKFDGSEYDVLGQRYALSGAPLGPEFRVNTATGFSQSDPVVAADSAGNFVVVWSSMYQASPAGPSVYGQRYASSGVPLGGEFRVNTYVSGTSVQGDASVRVGSLGDFVAVWSASQQDGSMFGIYGQRYSGSGAPLGPEFRVNTFTPGYQGRSDVAVDASGNFVVVWASNAEDGSGFGIFGQRYASTGEALGPQFRVNTYTTQDQDNPSVGADPMGNFVVVWGSEQDGYNIFGQRYGPIFPVELVHFRVE